MAFQILPSRMRPQMAVCSNNVIESSRPVSPVPPERSPAGFHGLVGVGDLLSVREPGRVSLVPEELGAAVPPDVGRDADVVAQRRSTGIPGGGIRFFRRGIPGFPFARSRNDVLSDSDYLYACIALSIFKRIHRRTSDRAGVTSNDTRSTPGATILRAPTRVHSSRPPAKSSTCRAPGCSISRRM